MNKCSNPSLFLPATLSQCALIGPRLSVEECEGLPPGVRVERCWCGDVAKVKEAEDFSDKFSMQFFKLLAECRVVISDLVVSKASL
jgi:hypothetical protein